ncbi:MAG TPA: hypothetical protein VMX12_08780 [Acidimicrobiia bacterium]|nr:hypothetical protein [Acidimicrobiia bacterium]
MRHVDPEGERIICVVRMERQAPIELRNRRQKAKRELTTSDKDLDPGSEHGSEADVAQRQAVIAAA